MNPLDNLVAVVTGAGSGIGRAVALALASRQVRLTLIGRNSAHLEEVAGAAGIGSDRLILTARDLTEKDAVTDIARQTHETFGCIDILIHSAGIVEYGSLLESDIDLLDRHLDINLRVPYALTRALLPSIISHQGQIVFINSSIIDWPKAGASQYGASKHALKGMADGLRQEVNEAGVRVLSIFPGRTATPRQEQLHRVEGRSFSPENLLQPEDVASIILSALSLPGTAEVTDIKIRPMKKP